jgi:hypothetical protein
MTVTHVVRLLTISALVPMLLAVQIGSDDLTAEQGVVGDLLLGPPVTSAGFLLSVWLLHQGSAIENFRGPQPNLLQTLSAASVMQLPMI